MSKIQVQVRVQGRDLEIMCFLHKLVSNAIELRLKNSSMRAA